MTSSIGNGYEAYRQILQNERKLYPDGAFPDRLKRESLYFEYGGRISLESFKEGYNSKNWLQRKVTALPLVVLSVLKVALHLFNAVIEPFFLAVGDSSGKIRKAELFACAQDFKEAFGRIVTLFNDIRGSLLVQQALFQKSYYNFSCEKSVNPPFELNISMRKDAEKISLFDLRRMDEEKRKEIVRTFELDSFVEAFSGVKDGFWKVLADADEKMLQLFTIWDIKRDRQTCFLQKEYFEIPIFLRKEEGLLSIPMEDVYLFQEGAFSESRMKVLFGLKKRLLMVEGFLPPDIKGLDEKTIFEMSFTSFLHVPSGIINQYIEEIPSWAFCCLSEGQAREIDLTKLSKEQMLGFLSVCQDEIKERVRMIPEEWIKANKGKLGLRYEQLLLDWQNSLTDLGEYGTL